jgi:hypothetical protein
VRVRAAASSTPRCSSCQGGHAHGHGVCPYGLQPRARLAVLQRDAELPCVLPHELHLLRPLHTHAMHTLYGRDSDSPFRLFTSNGSCGGSSLFCVQNGAAFGSKYAIYTKLTVDSSYTIIYNHICSSPATLVLIWIRGRDEIGNAGQIPFYKVVVMFFQMIGNHGVKIPPCKMESALHSQDLYVNDWRHAGKWGFSAIYTVTCTVWQKWTVPREFQQLSASRRGAVCWVWPIL